MKASTQGGKGTKPAGEGDLRDFEADLRNKQQIVERTVVQLKKQTAERDALNASIQSMQLEIGEMEKSLMEHEQVIARSPTITDALRKRRKIDASAEELKKEIAFVERQTQDFQNKFLAAQSDRAMKENVLSNKKMALEQMNPDQNRGVYQAAQAEIRMLESDLNRGGTTFDRSQEDSRRFEARLFDLQTKMKQLKLDQRKAEQDETIARRLEIYIAERDRIKHDMETKQETLNKSLEDLKKIDISVTKLEERLQREKDVVDAAKRVLSNKS